MRARLALALGLLAWVCWGAPPIAAQQTGTLDVSRGVGGFTGEVRPIQRPVLLRYQSVAQFRFTLRAEGRFEEARSGLRPFSLATEGAGSIRRQGSIVDWSVQVTSMTVEDRVLKASVPLVEFRVRTDPLGDEIDSPDIEAPGLRELAIAADPADISGPVDAWIGYPEAAVKAGDLITPMSIEGLLPLPDGASIHNTVTVVARGLATVDGRELLVGEVVGGVAAAHAGTEFSAQAKGYWLIDLETGLHRGRVRLDVVSSGRSLRQRGIVSADFDYRPI